MRLSSATASTAYRIEGWYSVPMWFSSSKRAYSASVNPEQLTVDVLIVLTEQRCVPCGCHGRAARLPDTTDVHVRAGLRVGDLLEEPPRCVLAVIEGDRLVHHDAGGDPHLLQPLHDPVSVDVRGPRPDLGVELVAVGVAARHVGEARVGDEVATTHHVAQRTPLVLVADGDGDPRVRAVRAVDVVRGEPPVVVAHAVQRRSFIE